MTHFLLARHGETDHNRNHIMQGVTDAELNETGIDQAEKLRERLEDVAIDAAYSSGLQRAKKTAEIAAEPHGLTVEQRDGLNERNYGIYEGKPADEYHSALDAFDGSRYEWQPEGGEHMRDVAERGMTALNQIKDTHENETVLVLAHGTMNRALMASMLGAEPGYGLVFSQANTCLNNIRWRPGWNIRYVNDTRHL